jgi:hypothetical protein
MMLSTATRTTALPAATSPTAPTCASERLRAATQRAAAPTAALQPTCSTAAPKAPFRPPSAPPATAHASRALPAASVPLQATLIRSYAKQAHTPPLLALHFAPPVPRARFRLPLVRLHATSALPAPTVLQLRRSSAAAPSTLMHPLPVVPAPAALVLGRLYPPQGRASV